MPKARQTCTRCSMRRQKCDRKSPCTRCVQNKEAHLCTREWPNGYNPDVHRKYPKRDTVPHLSAWTGPTGGPTPPTSVAHDHSGTIEEILPLHSNHPPPAPNAYAPSCHPHSHNGLAPQLRLLSPDDERTEQYPPSSNVDFITYGRSDVSDITLDSLLTDDNPYQQSKNISQTQNRMEKTMDPSITLSSNARSAEGLYIQSLLPSREQVFEMVHYHERDMLYWSGGVYHGPSFRKSLLEAYGQSSTLQLQELDWRWSALLFSILSAAVIASPDHLSATWGYSTPEKSHLTKQWGRAAISCLLLGDYTSKFHIYSIQAILNLHSSEHLVGSSREYGLLQTTSIVIARGLGLHRLIPHPDDQKDASELSPAQKDALMQREIGRRVWYSLCFQDWLCVMSSGMYTIQRKHITAARPGHYDEETMTRVDDTRPTWTHCTNYLVDMAALLVDFHDDIPVQNDLEARYEVVLRYDTKIRSLYASKLPWFLSYNTPFDPSWPRWVLWSRRLHQISSYHKIIMVHQSFLGRSFKNPRYTYTRWACTTAAKGIIDYMSSTDIDDGPQWWIEQAFLVTGGICLGLDVFHRPDSDFELKENKIWVEKAIVLLQKWPNSTIASHGARLLASLLHERAKRSEGRHSVPLPAAASLTNNVGPFTVISAAADAAESNSSRGSVNTPQPPVSMANQMSNAENWFPSPADSGDGASFDQLMETFPFEAGLDNQTFFSDFLTELL